MTKCAFGDCKKDARSRGWCDTHYTRWKRHGDASATQTPGRGNHDAFIELAANHKGPECLPWPYGRLPNGRGSCSVGRRTVGAHRLVCIMAHGEPPFANAEAAHSCGNGHGGCVSAAHLYWATGKQNQADRIKHGTDLRGSDNPRSVLTDADVKAIREDQRPQAQIAKDYGITQAAVSLIVTRKNWAHVA